MQCPTCRRNVGTRDGKIIRHKTLFKVPGRTICPASGRPVPVETERAERVESPELRVHYMRGEPHADGTKCICCPDEPTHVFAYLPMDGTSRFDETMFLHHVIRQYPDGQRFRVIIEPIEEN